MTEQQPEVAAMLEQIKSMGFEAFQTVISLGRWSDGTRLTPEEQGLAMQALIIYEHQNVPLSERTGFIHKGSCSS